MSTVSTRSWESLEKWSPTAFLGAGVLFFAFVVASVISGFTNIEGTWVLVAEGGTGLLGLIVAIVAVVGLYPGLRDRSPYMSRGAVLAFVAAVVGLIVALGWRLSASSVPTALTLLFSLSVLLIAVGFLLTTAASLRTETPSRTVGVLLFVPVIMWVWHYATFAFVGSMYLLTVIDYTVITAAFLAIGYRLQTESEPTSRTEPTPMGGSS